MQAVTLHVLKICNKHCSLGTGGRQGACSFLSLPEPDGSLVLVHIVPPSRVG